MRGVGESRCLVELTFFESFLGTFEQATGFGWRILLAAGWRLFAWIIPKEKLCKLKDISWLVG